MGSNTSSEIPDLGLSPTPAIPPSPDEVKRSGALRLIRKGRGAAEELTVLEKESLENHK